MYFLKIFTTCECSDGYIEALFKTMEEALSYAQPFVNMGYEISMGVEKE